LKCLHRLKWGKKKKKKSPDSCILVFSLCLHGCRRLTKYLYPKFSLQPYLAKPWMFFRQMAKIGQKKPFSANVANFFWKCLWSNLAICFKEKQILLENIPLLILVSAFGEISHQRTTLIGSTVANHISELI
jgi:hypothetical protein